MKSKVLSSAFFVGIAVFKCEAGAAPRLDPGGRHAPGKLTLECKEEAVSEAFEISQIPHGQGTAELLAVLLAQQTLPDSRCGHAAVIVL